MVSDFSRYKFLNVISVSSDRIPLEQITTLLQPLQPNLELIWLENLTPAIARAADLLILLLNPEFALNLSRQLKTNPDTVELPLLYIDAVFLQNSTQTSSPSHPSWNETEAALAELVNGYLTLPLHPLTLQTTVRHLVQAGPPKSTLVASAEPCFSCTPTAHGVEEEPNNWLNLALDAAGMGSWDWDLRTGQILWSPFHEEIFGYEPGKPQRTYQDWYNRIHPDDRVLVEKAMATALAKQSLLEVEYRVRWPNGHIRWVNATGRYSYDRQGQAIRMVGMLTDITQRRYAEELLKKQAEELTRINQVKDEFLATLSHELRTPLHAILGWAQLLRHRQLDPEKVNQGLEAIERNARLQTNLVEDLLDISRIIQGKLRLIFALFELVPVIRAAIAAVMTTAAAKHIHLSLQIEPCAPKKSQSDYWVLGDSDRLQQILWNLLMNAIKFTPPAGQVEVKLSQFCSEPQPRGGENSRDNYFPTTYAKIQVSDTGIGIAPENLPFVFDRFYQGDSSSTRAYGGLGLGLALVRHLTELHGGSIEVDSKGEGLGSTFTLVLPLQPYPHLDPAELEKSP
uniref:histidine kinase n=1 Tax=Cyanothece sp. (strain PCC 7425 / ATCC 29141) TaxID=395961 RepID=B8HSF3_CYAP4